MFTFFCLILKRCGNVTLETLEVIFEKVSWPCQMTMKNIALHYIWPGIDIFMLLYIILLK